MADVRNYTVFTNDRRPPDFLQNVVHALRLHHTPEEVPVAPAILPGRHNIAACGDQLTRSG
jgi:hypothetical protein